MVIALAWVLHVTVEVPTHNWGTPLGSALVAALSRVRHPAASSPATSAR